MFENASRLTQSTPVDYGRPRKGSVLVGERAAVFEQQSAAAGGGGGNGGLRAFPSRKTSTSSGGGSSSSRAPPQPSEADDVEARRKLALTNLHRMALAGRFLGATRSRSKGWNALRAQSQKMVKTDADALTNVLATASSSSSAIDAIDDGSESMLAAIEEWKRPNDVGLPPPPPGFVGRVPSKIIPHHAFSIPEEHSSTAAPPPPLKQRVSKLGLPPPPPGAGLNRAPSTITAPPTITAGQPLPGQMPPPPLKQRVSKLGLPPPPPGLPFFVKAPSTITAPPTISDDPPLLCVTGLHSLACRRRQREQE